MRTITEQQMKDNKFEIIFQLQPKENQQKIDWETFVLINKQYDAL